MPSRKFYLERLNIESEVTRQVLKALPGNRLDYKPDERCPSAHQLAWLLAYELQSNLDVVSEGKANWKNIPPPLDEILRAYTENVAKLGAGVEKLDEKTWENKAQFLYEGQLIAEHTVREFLWLTLFDSIHHRGQITAYLRPMGGKVPAIYGPSADEPGGHGAWRSLE